MSNDFQHKDYIDVAVEHPGSFVAGKTRSNSSNFHPRLHARESVGQNNNWVFDAEFDSMQKASSIYTAEADPVLINVANKNKFIQLINNSFVNYLTIISAGSLILISLVDKRDTSKRYVVKILLQKTDDEQFLSFFDKKKKSVLEIFYQKINELKKKDVYNNIFTENQRVATVGIQDILDDYEAYKEESDIQSLIAERYIGAESEMKENSGSYPFSPKMHSLHSVEGANTEILEALLKNITPEAKRMSDFFDASNVAKQKRKNRFLAEYITELILVKPYLPLVFIVMESVPKYFKTINNWTTIFDETLYENDETEYTIKISNDTFIFNRRKNAYWVYIQLYRMARLGFNHCDTHGKNIFIANPIITVKKNDNTQYDLTLLEIFDENNKDIGEITKRGLGRRIGIELKGEEVKEIEKVYEEQNTPKNIPLIYLIDFGLSKILDSTETWDEKVNAVIKCFKPPYFGLIHEDIFSQLDKEKVRDDCKKLPNPNICETNITQPNISRDGYYEAKWEEIGDKVDCFSCKTACKKRKELMDERKKLAVLVTSQIADAPTISDNENNNQNTNQSNLSVDFSTIEIDKRRNREAALKQRENNKKEQNATSTSPGDLFGFGNNNNVGGNYGGARRKKRKKTRKKRRKRRTRKQKKRSKATKRKKVKKTKTRKLK